MSRTSSIDKTVASADDAVADVPDGASLAVGGFGLSGVPIVLIDALSRTSVTDLHVASNNCGTDGWGLGILLEQHRIARVVASYIGENKEFARQYLSGELEVELTPQGTLAERLRAAGSGVPAFYTPAGVGTWVADGAMPWRYAPDGSVAVSSPPKEVREFEVDGERKPFVLERSLVCDFGLVRAWKGDRHGNLVFHRSARNFNPLAAMAGRTTIAEVEQLVEPGEIDPDDVHVPGIFVHRVVELTAEQAARKHIEKRTTREA
ncbi:MAG: Succinyl-CoA:3-ketoacid-coenzyme A transferase subunit A [uncultured Actinomycetospora sp.]|uniref:Succinyl-CoA:3-ketoacid-coenzyme A transferase subunit A n=1 Tax=uncultured Actinomycetospora sp. TaxID=1135996 RepID=A0A6J4HD51_9PSEU|nr:MAG: Succinyl-CoA:3-ketoacid-coenzyme A transferase subunit A [uncultured Actinomycetospora sp.]